MYNLYRFIFIRRLKIVFKAFLYFIKQVTLLIIIFKIHFYDNDPIHLIKILDFQQVTELAKKVQKNDARESILSRFYFFGI